MLESIISACVWFFVWIFGRRKDVDFDKIVEANRADFVHALKAWQEMVDKLEARLEKAEEEFEICNSSFYEFRQNAENKQRELEKRIIELERR